MEAMVPALAGIKPPQGPYQVASKVRRKLGLPRSSAFFEEPVINQYAKDNVKKIREASPDVVFALAGSTFAWSTPGEFPLVYASDATFRLVENYHLLPL